MFFGGTGAGPHVFCGVGAGRLRRCEQSQVCCGWEGLPQQQQPTVAATATQCWVVRGCSRLVCCQRSGPCWLVHCLWVCMCVLWEGGCCAIHSQHPTPYRLLTTHQPQHTSPTFLPSKTPTYYLTCCVYCVCCAVCAQAAGSVRPALRLPHQQQQQQQLAALLLCRSQWLLQPWETSQAAWVGLLSKQSQWIGR